MPKYLNDEQRCELTDWLFKHQLNIEKLHRECSDGVIVANLLKNFYPKFVELHNYQPRSSFKLKLVNWETLNFKVLKRIGIPQNKKTLEQLSNGVPVVLEKLFYDIMCLEREKTLKPKPSPEKQELYTEDDTIVINISKIIGDAIIRVPQKMIKYSSYQKVINDNKIKDDLLFDYQNKITEMEDLLKEKTVEIDTLCNQLAHQTVASLMEQCKNSDKETKTA